MNGKIIGETQMNDAFKQPFSLFFVIAPHYLLGGVALDEAPY